MIRVAPRRMVTLGEISFGQEKPNKGLVAEGFLFMSSQIEKWSSSFLKKVMANTASTTEGQALVIRYKGLDYISLEENKMIPMATTGEGCLGKCGKSYITLSFVFVLFFWIIEMACLFHEKKKTVLLYVHPWFSMTVLNSSPSGVSHSMLTCNNNSQKH